MTQTPKDDAVRETLEDLVPNVDPKGGETKKKETTTQQEYLQFEIKNVQITSYSS